MNKTTYTPRVLIVGTGESGKSLLAKSIATELSKGGMYVTVYDPVSSTDWPDDAFVSPSEEKFFEELNALADSGQRQAVFVDEADTLYSIGQKQNHWVLTRGRHFGIQSYTVTQRPALVAPTIRSLCNELYVFRVSKADAKLLADDFAHEGILNATELNQGEFLRCHWSDRKKTVDKGRIF